MVAPETRHKMESVLISVAYIRPSLGYRQGMSFIVGELLTTVKSEDLTFWLFFGLLSRYGLEFVLTGGLLADLHVHLVKTLLESHLPSLSAHLQDLGVTWDVLVKNYVLSLGAVYIPLEFLSQAFDVFFMDGWIGLYKVAVALFESCEAKMCRMNLEELTSFIKKIRKSILEKEMKKVFHRIVELRIERETIKKAMNAFFKKQAIKYLSRDCVDWPAKYSYILQQAAEHIKQIVAQHSADLEYYKHKLAHIEAFLIR
eukprot:TRINITY_DN7873_c0_g1_i1.p1 TRINITY_DN7873_c0_g1~~TRINITY_DN7873_c0_g1_i1.p1  ORF type:complete len:257 (+),score=63.06 TRINITY_DN7873_c0_g1_i1:658-1428(+)